MNTSRLSKLPRRIVRSGLLCTVLIASCRSDHDVSGPVTPPPRRLPLLAYASDTALMGDSGSVAFVGLPVETRSSGTRAIIRDATGRVVRVVAMTDGGFDPVPVAALPGDDLKIEIEGSEAGSPEALAGIVPARSKPRVVRTYPPHRRRDVPLNTRIVAVFSEPMNPELTSAGIVLLRDGTPVTGEVTLDGTIATFTPRDSLRPRTDYVLELGETVRDLDGDGLDEVVRIEFTTEQSPDSEPPVVERGSRVAAGWAHTCALNAAGRAFCWGDNSAGQLGDGTLATTSSPVAVLGDMRFTSIVAGGMHTCGLTRALEVYCWGGAREGTTPALLVGVPPLVFIASKFWHTCGLTGAGEAWCWGDNTGGQLGDGSPPDNGPWGDGVSGGPGPVIGGLRFTRLATGNAHTCGLVASGAAYCWGMNDERQLGVSSALYSTGPALVEGALQFVAVTAGISHTCGLTAGGETHCWGGTSRGDPGGASFAAISAGSFRTCALTGSGAALCWGEEISGRDWGGSGATSSVTPVEVAGGVPFVELDVGDKHACGLTALDAVHCWGHNENGQLGDGTALGWMPQKVVNVQFSSVHAGQQHSCGLSSGRVFCWGDGEWGQLGSGSRERAAAPIAVPGMVDVKTISTNGHRVCALTEAGDAYCWGETGIDALTNYPLYVLSPTHVTGGPFSELAVGRLHTCALTPQGAAFCWGDNAAGQLGADGTLSHSDSPIDVRGNITFRSLTAGSYHTCGVSIAGAAYCWGTNQLGELGNGTLGTTQDPQEVVGGHRFVSLSAGARHTCGLTDSGTAHCWGFNDRGALGRGHAIVQKYPSPQPVAGGIRFAAISAEYDYTCGVSTSGEGYCWGSNWWGRFATDARIDAFPAPKQINIPVPLASIATGSYHACGLMPLGTAYCWGEVHNGQLGRGHFGFRLSATAVRPYSQ